MSNTKKFLALAMIVLLILPPLGSTSPNTIDLRSFHSVASASMIGYPEDCDPFVIGGPFECNEPRSFVVCGGFCVAIVAGIIGAGVFEWIIKPIGEYVVGKAGEWLEEIAEEHRAKVEACLARGGRWHIRGQKCV